MSSYIDIVPIIEAVAHSVRLRLDLFVKEGRPGWRSDLRGCCGLASVVVAKSLRARDIPANVMYTQIGHYPKGHCWVESKGFIIDVTATQFGYERVVILSAKGSVAKRRGYKGIIKGLDSGFFAPRRWYPSISKYHIKKFMVWPDENL